MMHNRKENTEKLYLNADSRKSLPAAGRRADIHRLTQIDQQMGTDKICAHLRFFICANLCAIRDYLHSKRMFQQTRKAFTLIEVMLTISMFAIILAAIFLVLTSGRNTWLSGTTYTEVHQEARKAKEWMTKELCQGRNTTVQMPNSAIIGNTMHSARIIFQIPLNIAPGGGVGWQTVDYYLGGTNNRQLLRHAGADTKVIANDITAIDFARDQDKPMLLSVAITVSKQNVRGSTETAVLNLKIKFRN